MADDEIQVDGEPRPLSPGELRRLLEVEIWPLIPQELDEC